MSKKLKMAEDSSEEEAKPHQMELETDMIVQKATQAVANRYEAEIKRLKRFHEKEMETLIKGRKSMIKPSLWARITRRYKDIYIVYNHRMPVYCHRKDCETATEGVNWGIEWIGTTIEGAMEAADEYFYEWRHHVNYASIKILHMQVDRRSTRGAVVKDITLKMKDWNPESKKMTKASLEESTADSAIVNSLVANRPSYKK